MKTRKAVAYCSKMGPLNPTCPICKRVRHQNGCSDGKLDPETQCAYQESEECITHANHGDPMLGHAPKLCDACIAIKSKPPHTPGPWNQEGGRSIHSEKWRMDRIALTEQASPRMSMAEVKANARLIAASPDLLEALKEMRTRYDRLEKLYAEKAGIEYDAQNGTIERADRAIAKAEGR